MKRINVDIGDIVHEGETLAVLESSGVEGATRGNGIPTEADAGRRSHARSTEVQSAEAMNSALHAASDRAQAGLPGPIRRRMECGVHCFCTLDFSAARV